jgi:hypothetical protein
MAVMVLGANGCGDDDKASTDERFDELGRAGCRLAFSCDPEDGWDNEDWATEQECVEQFTAEVKSQFEGISEACRKAFLDYYECYVGSGCDGDVERCLRLQRTYYEVCEAELGAEDL